MFVHFSAGKRLTVRVGADAIDVALMDGSVCEFSFSSNAEAMREIRDMFTRAIIHAELMDEEASVEPAASATSEVKVDEKEGGR